MSYTWTNYFGVGETPKPVSWNRTMTESPEQAISSLKVSILAYGEKPGQTTHFREINIYLFLLRREKLVSPLRNILFSERVYVPLFFVHPYCFCFCLCSFQSPFFVFIGFLRLTMSKPVSWNRTMTDHQNRQLYV